MFSATAQDWVPVKDLSIGEELQTSRGRESVAALGYQKGRHQVYNLEVEAEHCYFVGNAEALTHNDCDVTSSAKQKPLNSPDPKKWAEKGGTVDADWTYTDKDGNSVLYKDGYPDFKAGGHVKAEVEIQQKGNRTSDFSDATKANGGSKPKGTTWHHHQNGTTMQAVDSKVHRAFTHRGGVSMKKRGKR